MLPCSQIVVLGGVSCLADIVKTELVRQHIDRIVLPNEDWGRQLVLPSQTKSLEERTNDSIRIFQSTFQGRKHPIWATNH